MSLRQTLRCARQLKPDMFWNIDRDVMSLARGGRNDGPHGLHRRLLNERQVIVGRHWAHREAGNDVQNAPNRSGADGFPGSRRRRHLKMLPGGHTSRILAPGPDAQDFYCRRRTPSVGFRDFFFTQCSWVKLAPFALFSTFIEAGRDDGVPKRVAWHCEGPHREHRRDQHGTASR